jgi:hypothetical protein
VRREPRNHTEAVRRITALRGLIQGVIDDPVTHSEVRRLLQRGLDADDKPEQCQMAFSVRGEDDVSCCPNEALESGFCEGCQQLAERAGFLRKLDGG